MRTTFIPNTTYRAAMDNDCLFVFDDLNNELVMRISPITPSKEELKVRNFDSVEEFQIVEIQRMIVEELQIESVNIEHLFTFK